MLALHGSCTSSRMVGCGDKHVLQMTHMPIDWPPLGQLVGLKRVLSGRQSEAPVLCQNADEALVMKYTGILGALVRLQQVFNCVCDH